MAMGKILFRHAPNDRAIREGTLSAHGQHIRLGMALSQRHHRVEVPGLKPVVSVEKQNGPVALIDRRDRAKTSGRVAVVAMGLGQDDVIHIPASQLRAWMTIRDHHMSEWPISLLLLTAAMTALEYSKRFLVIGRDNGCAPSTNYCAASVGL